MKQLKDYKPEEFGANRDEINSLIMEQASDCAVERMTKEYNLPFEAFIEPDIEEGETADENASTRYKAEYQEVYNQLYDQEYNRIAAEIGFDLCSADGNILLSIADQLSAFEKRNLDLVKEIRDAIILLMSQNNITEIDVSEVADSTNVVWWDCDGYVVEGEVTKVLNVDGKLEVEIEYENTTQTLSEYDFALGEATWLNSILSSIIETLKNED